MILIFGYLGFNNYGDELLAQILTEKLLVNKPDEVIEHLSKKNTSIEHFQKLVKAKEIYAIGGMFQDLSSYASPLYYFFVLLFAKALGKKIIIEAQGLGPLNYWFNRQFAKTIFRLADEVSVRNSYSSDLLKEWGVKHQVVPDLAWKLKEKFEDYNSHVIASPRSGRGNPVFEKFSDDEKYLFISLKSSNTIGMLTLPITKKIVFLEMQDGDHFLHEKLAKDLNLKDEQCIFIEAKNYQPEELIYILKNYCSKLITMRFHAMIMGQIAAIEVEVLNPNNDPKLYLI